MCVFSSPAERAYEISHSGPASRPEERENSIFVAALKEHVQKGSLDTRIDHLLTEAAEGIDTLTGRVMCLSHDGRGETERSEEFPWSCWLAETRDQEQPWSSSYSARPSLSQY